MDDENNSFILTLSLEKNETKPCAILNFEENRSSLKNTPDFKGWEGPF